MVGEHPAPIDGRPKEKTEKMHPEIWRRYALFAIAILLAGIVAYFATYTPSAPVKTGAGPPSGDAVKIPLVVTGTATPTATTGANSATGLEVKYINSDSTLKLSEIELGKIYIEKANPPSSVITGAFFVVAIKDIPTISSINVGETTLSNFRVVQTTPERDVATIEWNIASAKQFSISMATLSKLPLSQENMVDSGPAIEISGQNNKLGRYSFDKWSQARYVYIAVNSP